MENEDYDNINTHLSIGANQQKQSPKEMDHRIAMFW